MTLVLKDGTSWAETYRRCMQVAPEAFDSDRIRNLIGGEWTRAGAPGEHRTPVDGTEIEGPPRIDHDEAAAAVDAAVLQHHAWASVGLDERIERVARAVAAMREHRDLLALLLVWEIGKPWRLACADVDRALDGVDWYVAEAERQLAGPPAARRAGQQHRVVELPDERAGARRAGAGAGRQRGHREDAEPGRLPLPDPRARADGPRGPAR